MLKRVKMIYYNLNNYNNLLNHWILKIDNKFKSLRFNFKRKIKLYLDFK